MKIGLCSWSYNREFKAGRMDLEKCLNVCAEKLKVGGIDIIDVHLKSREPDYLLKIKKLATDLQITISAVSPGNSFGKDKEADEKAEVDNVNKWTDVAYILGAPNLRIFAGWGPMGKWPKVVKSIKKCAKYAQTKGVTLAIESHNGGGYLPTSVQTHKLLDEVDSPWVKLNLDTGNYQDKDLYAALKKSIPYATHMHAKVHDIDKDGKQSEFDYDKIFKIIKDANYRGFLNVEYEGKGEEPEYVPIVIEMIKRYARKYEL